MKTIADDVERFTLRKRAKLSTHYIRELARHLNASGYSWRDVLKHLNKLGAGMTKSALAQILGKELT